MIRRGMNLSDEVVGEEAEDEAEEEVEQEECSILTDLLIGGEIRTREKVIENTMEGGMREDIIGLVSAGAVDQEVGVRIEIISVTRTGGTGGTSRKVLVDLDRDRGQGRRRGEDQDLFPTVAVPLAQQSSLAPPPVLTLALHPRSHRTHRCTFRR